jgi:hypothetical protein
MDPRANQAIRSVAQRSVGAPLTADHRLTLNFHPDVLQNGRTVIEALAKDQVYRSQFETGTSNGGLTAFVNGDRWKWESRIFDGAYDEVNASLRPKYGALNYRDWPIGGAPRFGSCHLRLAAHTLQRTTFCYPDSYLEPQDFGVAGAMDLIALAEANPTGLDLIDNYIEAHVHGVLDVATDVEALVLDPSYLGTSVDAVATKLPCPVEWHQGFRLPLHLLDECARYRSEAAAELLALVARDEFITPRDLSRARGHAERQVLRQAWHCIARLGTPISRQDQHTTRGPHQAWRHPSADA